MERYRKVMLRVVDSPGIHQYVITTLCTLRLPTGVGCSPPDIRHFRGHHVQLLHKNSVSHAILPLIQTNLHNLEAFMERSVLQATF